MPDFETDPIRPERTENPAYLSRGAWYVDDGMQVVFFDTKGEAQQYADLTIASDAAMAANLRVPDGATIDCVIAGCRFGTPGLGLCACTNPPGQPT